MSHFSSNNTNISGRSSLPAPGELRSLLPMTRQGARSVIAARKEICDILSGKSRKLIVIVGPCSIHNGEQALEYAAKLKKVASKVSDTLLPVMRVYFDKPRTTVGWKGMINDPDINGSYNIAKGLSSARKLLLDIVKLGLPAATEMLDPISAQYIADAVSYAAIGARTTEAQTHRQLASGLSMPVGFKNGTDGNLQVAIDAITAARSRHSFIGVLENGRVGVFRTTGNAHGHIILRGGPQPNYGAEYVAFAKVLLEKAGLPHSVVVDCSHANSRKDYRKQPEVFRSVLSQIENGERAIAGVMLESNLLPGSQKIGGAALQYGVSITDGCIGFDETKELLLEAHSRLVKII